jgi:hypothetical protein
MSSDPMPRSTQGQTVIAHLASLAPSDPCPGYGINGYSAYRPIGRGANVPVHDD